MGYTNHWYHKKPFTDVEWTKIKKEYKYVVENFNNVLIKDQTEDQNEICFDGIGQNSHETFILKKVNDTEPMYDGDDVTYNFCKTNRKPYDIVVRHILRYANHINDDKLSLKFEE